MSAAVSQLGVDCLERWLPAGNDGARSHRHSANADPCRTDDTDACSVGGRGPLPTLNLFDAGIRRCHPHRDDRPPAINRHSV